MVIFNHTMNTITDALDYSAKRNELISNNIANVDTPNFKTKDAAFKEVLGNAMDDLQAKRTHSKHFTFTNNDANKAYSVFTNHNTMYSHNGNNVDIDKEMADLAKNQIYYRSMVDRLNGKFNTLKTVIKGGR